MTSSTISWASDSRWEDTITMRPLGPGRLLGGVEPEEVPKPGDALWVEAVGRFVEDEDVWLAQKRPGELQPLAHAHREATTFRSPAS